MSSCSCGQANEQVTLCGRQLRLFQACDRMVDRWASELQAETLRFSPLISLELLEELDYLRSFPQLVHFAQVVAPEHHAALEQSGRCQDPHALQSSGHALLPAACYPIYAHLRQVRLTGTRLYTTVNTCFRNEEHFEPLRRQRCFTMREIVCVGTREAVVHFLDGMRQRLQVMLTDWAVASGWHTATDPFFRVEGNGKALIQRLAEVKQELIVDKLAIASTNEHGDSFSRRFDIRLDEELACTGCLAFGLERWVAVLDPLLPADETAWPKELHA